MNKRTRVISASALLVLGGFLVVTSLLGGSDLQATSVGANEVISVSRLLIWGGAGAVMLSALLYISASAE